MSESQPTFYENIINSLPDAVIVIDNHDQIRAVNLPLLLLLGKREADLIQRPVRVVLPQTADPLDRRDKLKSERTEIDIHSHIIDLNVAPLWDNDGTIQGRLLVLRDVTARKHMQFALHINERRYRALFENSIDGVLILDLDLSLLIANQQAADMFGIELEELLEKPEAVHFISPDERSLFGALIEQLKAGETIPLYETYFLRGDDTRFPVEVNFTLVRDTDGSPLHIQLIVRDISARKESELEMEERLSELAALQQVDIEANRSLEIARVLDVSLSITMMLTQADWGFIALERDSQMIVEKVAGQLPEAVTGNQLRYDQGVVGRVMQTRQPVFVPDVSADDDYFEDVAGAQSLIAVPLIAQDTLVGLINLETADASVFDDNVFQFIQLVAGRLASAVDNARLLDYVRQQLQETQQLNEELRQAEALKTDMIRIANHDLKNPLGIVQGYLNLLQLEMGELSDDQREYFDFMDEATERMHNILKDFLTLEAINERVKGATMTRIDLRTLVKRALAEYQQPLNAKLLHLQQTLVGDGLAQVRGDESQLYEAICNLLSNAIKYTPEGGTIHVELDVTPRLEAYYAVHDTGYGIPADRQHRLFQPFFRSKTAETATIEGSGLGLHLVKSIIDRHQGEMVFESTYQKGSTFGFQLPIAQS